jgi:hypothetical protein
MSTDHTEHIDERGYLIVPLARAMSEAPPRPGFKPWWVNVVLSRDPQKIVTYKPLEGPA